jgi:hypothetical protein
MAALVTPGHRSDVTGNVSTALTTAPDRRFRAAGDWADCGRGDTQIEPIWSCRSSQGTTTTGVQNDGLGRAWHIKEFVTMREGGGLAWPALVLGDGATRGG